MTESLTFTIAFHGPFRVSTGNAAAGVNATVDTTNPLPSTSLKGLMRATAAQLLGEGASIIDEIFGSESVESPWHWTSAEGTWSKPLATARVRIDDATHTAAQDMLATQEQISASTATFTVSRRGYVKAERLAAHRLVLAIAGQATRSLGADRRRGLGWVTISCPDVAFDTDTVATFLELGAP